MKIILQAIKSLFQKAEGRLDATIDAVNSEVQRETAKKMNNVDPIGSGSFSMNRDTSAVIGDYSHAEGVRCRASGNASHAEGNESGASGSSSHAEGFHCTANGNSSHAEGYGTKADGQYQHAQGKWNTGDSESKYANIVGNGTSVTARSNAHTLDWSGLGWFAGGLKVGGTGQDDEDSRTVMVNGDTQIVLTSPSGKKFAITVSDDGTLTATAQ